MICCADARTVRWLAPYDAGVGRPASTARRTALLKEPDPGSKPAERGWSHLWCPRTAHAGEPFLLPGFGQGGVRRQRGAAGDQGVGATARGSAGGRGWWSGRRCRCETTIIGMSSMRTALPPENLQFCRHFVLQAAYGGDPHAITVVWCAAKTRLDA